MTFSSTTSDVVNVRPVKIPFLFPAWRKRSRPEEIDTDGIEVTFYTFDQPTCDGCDFLEVDGNGYCDNYPFLAVLCVMESVVKNGEAWVKTRTFIPMI